MISVAILGELLFFSIGLANVALSATPPSTYRLLVD